MSQNINPRKRVITKLNKDDFQVYSFTYWIMINQETVQGCGHGSGGHGLSLVTVKVLL